jgi:phosphatidylserine decarboxylase
VLGEAAAVGRTLLRVTQQEDVNFLLTNRIPRRVATRFVGWFSKIRQPQVRDASIAVWRLFANPDFEEARRDTFRSLHDCFIRELKPGARRIDPDPSVLVSPCDAIVGAMGEVEGNNALQAKGAWYPLADLLVDPALVERYRDGRYVTLRLTSSMYHRFHAPHDCRVNRVTYVSGDTWNTNPIALARVERLFCKNERAVIETTVSQGHAVTMVPVASILVASIRLHFLDVLLHLTRRGPNVIPCDAALRKGEEMGWFELGSTIIVFVPRQLRPDAGLATGRSIRMGEPLFHLP